MTDLITSAEAAKLAGVGPTAIKRWADSGRLPCVKTAGGHRRFERQPFLEWLRSGQPDEGWSDWIEVLSQGADVHTFQARLFEERGRRGSWHAVAEHLADLVTEIGCRWEAGVLSVIQEHLASATLQRALAFTTETIPIPPQARRCLLATAEGDTHTLGLSLVELCLREAGWRAEWAGSHTRTSDVIDRIHTGGIRMIALSAAASSSNAVALAAALSEVADACRPGIALALGGGGAWPDDPPYGTRFRSLVQFYEFARTL